MEVILKAENLKKYYGSGDTKTKALDDINIEIHRGEFIGIIGSSGSGKSTLLHLLGALDYASSGKIYIKNKNILNMDETERTIFRRKNIGFIFQNFNLIPVLSVYENIVLPLQLDGQKVDSNFVNEVLRFLGIYEKRATFPNMLSGGQQQRVAIARAIVMRPAIILADEPTGNLDSTSSDLVIKLLKEAREKYGQTVLIITHSMKIAAQTDRIIHIEDGRIIGGVNHEK